MSTHETTEAPAPEMLTTAPPELEFKNYLYRIKDLYKILPHLEKSYEKLFKIPQRVLKDEPRVDIYDFSVNSPNPVTTTFGQNLDVLETPRVLGEPEPTFRPIADLGSFLREATAAESRLVIVEDVSVDVVNALGDAFALDPEFFAGHLVDAIEWDPRLKKGGLWRLSPEDMLKEYVSLLWARPVQYEFKQILGNVILSAMPIRQQIAFLRETTIIRQFWDLLVSSGNADTDIPALWGERASLYLVPNGVAGGMGTAAPRTGR